MNTVERFTAAYKGTAADRVPVCGWLGMPWLQRRTGKTILALLEEFVENPLAIVEIQESLGLDPIVITVDERWFSMHNYWRLLYSWPKEALENWQVTQDITETGKGFVNYRFTANTPDGPVVWGYQVGSGQVSELERPIKVYGRLHKTMRPVVREADPVERCTDHTLLVGILVGLQQLL